MCSLRTDLVAVIENLSSLGKFLAVNLGEVLHINGDELDAEVINESA